MPQWTIICVRCLTINLLLVAGHPTFGMSYNPLLLIASECH